MSFPKHEAAYKYAVHCIGIHESPPGSNEGAIQRTHPNAGIDLFQTQDFVAGGGYAWCVDFGLSCWSLGAKKPLPYLSPGAYAQGNWARKNGWAVPIGQLIPGDFCVWRVGSGHLSVFEKLEGGLVHTIDGNYDNQVMRVTRSVSSLHTAIHIPEKPIAVVKVPKPFWVIATSASGHRQLLYTNFATEATIRGMLPKLLQKYGKQGITITKGDERKK